MLGPRRHPQAPDRAVAGPSWLRFGFLLAVGEIIMLVLVVFPPGAARGADAGRSQLGSSGARTHHAVSGGPSARSTPTTTLPNTPSPTVPASSVTPTLVPSAVVPAPTAPPATARAVNAPGVLAANISPQPNFLQSCSGSQYDDSLACVAATVQAIANGRSHEGLPPMVLPRNWGQLSPEEQIFVATNLERTARGLPPLTAMATSLDQAAHQGAVQSTDPGPPGGMPYSTWGSNWAGAVGNPLEAIYFWMYDDGASSANIDCTPSNHSGCWGHRENILLRLPCTVCLMGTGWAPTSYSGDPSMAELLVESSGSPAVDFTWQQESAYLS